MKRKLSTEITGNDGTDPNKKYTVIDQVLVMIDYISFDIKEQDKIMTGIDKIIDYATNESKNIKINLYSLTESNSKRDIQFLHDNFNIEGVISPDSNKHYETITN